MAGLTLSDCQTMLDNYKNALTAVLNSQSYSVAGRVLTRANLQAIQDGIKYWNSEVQKLTRGGIRVRGATPSF